ncbi:amidohydrolase [Nocardia beijingensis]
MPITNPIHWTCAGSRLHPVVLAVAGGEAAPDALLTQAVAAELQRDAHGLVDKPGGGQNGDFASPIALVNGRIFTADPDRPWAEACSISGDRIDAVGDTAEVLAAVGSGRVVDLAGRVVIPGLNDAHMHHTPDPAGVRLLLDESMDPPLTELHSAVEAAVAATNPGTWIFGTMGMTLITSTELDRAYLDRIAPDHPVILLGMTNHTNVLNSAALAALGISDDDVEVRGGTLGRDSTGNLNGRINEYAQWRPQRAFAAMSSIDEGAASIRVLADECVRYGVTTIQNMSWTPPERYLEMLRTADIPLRVRVIEFAGSGVSGRESVPSVQARAAAAARIGSRVSWSGRKWILDGTPVEFASAHGAPYLDRETTGVLNFSREDVSAMLDESVEAGDQLLLHAIGTAAVHTVVEALDQSPGAPNWSEHHLRIEHSDGATINDIRALRDHGAMIVQNPMHFLLTDMYETRFGMDHHYSAYRSLFESGIPVGIGSDGPLNPFIGIFAAVTHPTRPDERVDVETAISAYTTGSARAEGTEHEKGMIKPGFLADLAVLSQDIFSVEPQLLPATRSLLTIIGGELVLDDLPD